jgi:hypothetical protein
MRSTSKYTNALVSCPLAKCPSFTRSWIQTPAGWDLTRSQLLGSSANTTKVIPVNGKNSPLIIDTQRSALVIIDMQSMSPMRFIGAYSYSHLTVLCTDFFLHPAVQASSVGRDVVPATINMIQAFRANGMKVLWTNVAIPISKRLIHANHVYENQVGP